MDFYVSWVAHDPEYQGYDQDCSLLVSPVAQPKSWSVKNFRTLPRKIMLDSGSFYLLRNPDSRKSATEILEGQLQFLSDQWPLIEITICHLDHPIQGTDTKRCYDALETTIANAYELRALLLNHPLGQRLRERVRFLGVIQGVNQESIHYCARELVRVGIFDRFGLGSLAPLQHPTEIACRVRYALEIVDDLHVFGVSSLSAMRQLSQLGVRSFDSSRPIRAAIHCTLLYGTPLRGYTIAGTLKRPAASIRKRKPCACPVCNEHGRDLLRTGSKRFNNYRALHNYLALKQELCNIQMW